MKSRPQKNLWTSAIAERGAFIIGGADYFRAFREALIRAENYVCILAWDLMGGIDLLRDDSDQKDGMPDTLVDFLYALLERKPELEIYILLWDYSMVYLGEREWLPFTRFRREPHPRLHLKTDSAINTGASHHQKVVVVDGGFAFCGGLDLSAWRWDTQEHKPQDPRRTTPEGESYQPYHDIQTAMTGDAARKLDELCRERWKRATGEQAPWPDPRSGNKVWPESVQPCFREIELAFALTYSEYKDYPAVVQIEQLHFDMIAAAKRYIYIENQYLSSHPITEALIARLEEEDGPEVIIVLTRDTGGWLEEGTLGLLRARLLEKLAEADAHGHFAAYYPHVRDESGHESQVYVHAKVMICDDRSLMTGSANLSNRSMKVDSEVMLALGLNEAAQVARDLLRRLLGTHLGADPEAVDHALEEQASIRGAIRQLGKENSHQLRDLDIGCSGLIHRKLADTQLLDPDEPIDLGYWLKKNIATYQKSGKSTPPHNWVRYAKIAAGVIIVFLLGLALKEAWGSMIDKDEVETFFHTLNQSIWTAPLVFGIFLLAGLTGLSLNLLLVSATLIIGPWVAFAAGFLGSMLSAIAAFFIGQRAGQPILEKFFKERMRQLSDKIQNRGVLSVALLRLVPIAPFIVINLVAGLSKLRLRVFIIGSCLGMLPGMAAVVLVTHQAKSAYTNPGWQSWIWLFLGCIALAGLTFGVKRYLKK